MATPSIVDDAANLKLLLDEMNMSHFDHSSSQTSMPLDVSSSSTVKLTRESFSSASDLTKSTIDDIPRFPQDPELLKENDVVSSPTRREKVTSRDESIQPTNLEERPHTLVNKFLQSPRTGICAPPTTPETGPLINLDNEDAIAELLQDSVADLLNKRPARASLSESIHAPRPVPSLKNKSPLTSTNNIHHPRVSYATGQLHPEAQHSHNASFHRASFAAADDLQLDISMKPRLDITSDKKETHYTSLDGDSAGLSQARQEMSNAKYKRPNFNQIPREVISFVRTNLRSIMDEVKKQEKLLVADKEELVENGLISSKPVSSSTKAGWVPPHLRSFAENQEIQQLRNEKSLVGPSPVATKAPITKMSFKSERSSSEETITPVRHEGKPITNDEVVENPMESVPPQSKLETPIFGQKNDAAMGNKTNFSQSLLENDPIVQPKGTSPGSKETISRHPPHLRSIPSHSAPATEKSVNSAVLSPSEKSLNPTSKAENHRTISVATSKNELGHIEEDHLQSRSSTDETLAPSSMLFEPVSPDDRWSSSNKVTANAVATAEEDLENVLFFGTWPKPAERDKPAAKIRKVFLINLPPNSTAEFVASLVFGGSVEDISVSHSSASVRFLRHEDCMKYSEATRNGVVYKTERTEGGIKEHFAIVQPATTVSVIGGNLGVIMGYRATRCVQARGLASKEEALEKKKFMERDAIEKRMRIEGGSIEQSAGTNYWSATLRLCNIEDAWKLRMFLRRDDYWESVNLQHSDDPCAVATGVHF